MGFFKTAKLDVADYKWSPTKVTALDGYQKLSDFSFRDYITNDGYLYARVRAIVSKVNKNHDSWPADELKHAYRTFVGKPIFVDHHNHDPKRARGVVVDAELHVDDSKTSSLDPYFASKDVDPIHLPPTWVELLLEVDAKQFPRLAKAIISGDIDSVSMGADVGHTICNICSNKAEDPSQFCRHIISKGAFYDYHLPNGQKISRKAAEHCHKVSFFEISWVFEPAEESALALGVKEARVKMSKVAMDRPYDQEDPEAEWGESPGQSWDEGGEQNWYAPQISESDRVRQWRLDRFQELGFNPDMAAQLADNPRVDWHAIESLVSKGAPAEQALQIVSAWQKNAENPAPQSEMTRMPESIDTLRQDEVCPVCGDEMNDGECGLCGYVAPPEGFNNPDLSQAKEVDEQLHNEVNQEPGEEMDQANQVAGPTSDGSGGPGAGVGVGASGGMPPMTSKYQAIELTTGPDGSVHVSSRTTASTSPRINTSEKPLLPTGRQNSDQPLAVRNVQNPTKPIESSAKDNMNNTKTADGASPWGSGTSADNRVDVTGVGGVSGDPLSGISTENVEKDTGDFVAPHTDTWSNGEGDSLGQHDPVTSEAFEGAGGNGNSSGNAVGVSSPPGKSSRTADAEKGSELGGPIGDPATTSESQSGTTPDKPSSSGFPDHDPTRVDLGGSLAEEIGDRTKTFGTDDFHITEPVTTGNDANELGGPIGVKASSFGFAVKAMRLAETEQALGVLGNKSKWNRVAELETKSEEYIDAQLESLFKVKTAGLRRTAMARTAGRMPSLKPVTAAFDPETHGVAEQETQDSLSW